MLISWKPRPSEQIACHSFWSAASWRSRESPAGDADSLGVEGAPKEPEEVQQQDAEIGLQGGPPVVLGRHARRVLEQERGHHDSQGVRANASLVHLPRPEPQLLNGQAFFSEGNIRTW